MFTINDIKPLVKVPGATAVLIQKTNGEEVDWEIMKELEKQVKKATKLPVIFVPYGVEIEIVVEPEMENFGNPLD